MASEQAPLRPPSQPESLVADLLSFEAADNAVSFRDALRGNPMLSDAKCDPLGMPIGQSVRPAAPYGPSSVSPLTAQLLRRSAEQEPSRSAGDCDPLSGLSWPGGQPFRSTVGRPPIGPHDISPPFAGPLGPRAGTSRQAPCEPCPDQLPLHNAATQLLSSLMQMAQSQASVRPPVVDPSTPRPALPSMFKVHIPMYSGYSDRMSATEYLESLCQYQKVMRLEDSVIIGTIVPVSLTAQAARWYRLVGQRARSMEEFRTLFSHEFLPPDYERRMRRELELRTQHRDESLLEYVRAMQELYLLAEHSASNSEKVERVIQQAHPTFAAYLRNGRFHGLDDLAAEAKRIQGDILAARAYRPPPPASLSLEPRCAWNSGNVLTPALPANRRNGSPRWRNGARRVGAL
ncbi:uncharacterized protein LOC142559691 [Dermacentor variabilis]|uniref:uncharacterized protein LOC142559691 n=1 Tax=Dermacentor variabilis TaxID=34621 RepID=UPI003F5B30EF